jgi:hypothetical protein
MDVDEAHHGRPKEFIVEWTCIASVTTVVEP